MIVVAGSKKQQNAWIGAKDEPNVKAHSTFEIVAMEPSNAAAGM
jgi:hypothetical protein